MTDESCNDSSCESRLIDNIYAEVMQADDSLTPVPCPPPELDTVAELLAKVKSPIYNLLR
ncbi:MAG: hypothetical protein K2H75_05385 [Muribaculaceae bacterium]|nr:hypothetical protein [Muribaculaceae bacterium]